MTRESESSHRQSTANGSPDTTQSTESCKKEMLLLALELSFGSLTYIVKLDSALPPRCCRSARLAMMEEQTC